MKPFSRTPSASSFATAIRLHPDRLDVVSLGQGEGVFPALRLVESFPLQGGLAQSLTRLRQGGKLRGVCRVLLAPGAYQLHASEPPPLPDDAPHAELREAVRWKIKDMVSFPVAAAGIDVQPIPAQSGRQAQALAVAAEHTLLRPLIEAFQSAGIDLAQITVPEFAQRNIACRFSTPDRALALLTFNGDSGLLTVSCNGALYSARRLDVSAADLARDKALNERVVLDLQRSLDNFERNFSHLSLQRLLVLPVAGADDLLPHLAANLYQPVERLDIAGALEIGAKSPALLRDPTLLADALPVIGAALGALEGAPDINLYDPALKKQRDPWSFRNLGLGLAAALLLSSLPALWAHWRQDDIARQVLGQEAQLQTARDEAQRLTQQIAAHQPNAELQRKLDEANRQVQANGEVLAFLQKYQSPAVGAPAGWLRGLARRIPDGLWLTGFGINIESGALDIRGRTTDPRLIPEYVRRLNAEPVFQKRSFAALEIIDAAASRQTRPGPAATPQAPGPERFHEFALTSADQKGLP